MPAHLSGLPSPSPAIAAFLDSVSLAPHQSHKLLTLWPLVRRGSAPESGPAYLTLADALASGALDVRERQGGASVPVIEVVNRGDTAVLVLFGEVLNGAKQNRIANASFLVPAFDSLEIDVSCVEQGRWGGRSREFHAARSVVSSGIRRKMASKVARARAAGGSFDADQLEVWSEVQDRLFFSGSKSRTSDYADYVSTRQSDLSEAARVFHALPGQVGFVAAIGDQIAGLEAVGRQAVFARAFDGLLRAYLVDAVDAPQLRQREKEQSVLAAGFDAPEPFLAALAQAPASEGASLGLGRDLRLRGAGVAGCALVHEPAGLVHLTAFAEGGL
jgi:hypothetical protein